MTPQEIQARINQLTQQMRASMVPDPNNPQELTFDKTLLEESKRLNQMLLGQTGTQNIPAQPLASQLPAPRPQMSAPDPARRIDSMGAPAGTGGTPFLGFGVPGTSRPGEEGFFDPSGFWPESPSVAPPPPETPPPQVEPPPPPPPPSSTTQTIPYNPALPQGPTVPGPGGLEYQGARGANGQLLDPFDIPSIVLPGAPQVSSTLDQGAQDRYMGLMNTLAGQVQQQYDYTVPAFTAAEMELSGVPQGTAQQTAISPELQQMLKGEGYNPSILAQMRARASEGANQAGLTEMSQSRRALEQAGLGGSPAGAAVQGDVARRTGQARSTALRDVDIANAEQGIENAQFGIGQQTHIGLSNMQQANAMAMENANRIFSAMGQNLQNVQQARGAQFGAETGRLKDRADATTGVLGQQGGMWQAAAANTAQNAPFQNAQNTLTRDWNQAQLERQRQQTNLGTRESRWQTAVTGLPGFSPIPSPNFQNYQGGYNPFGD